jgi:hypothetical protein
MAVKELQNSSAKGQRRRRSLISAHGWSAATTMGQLFEPCNQPWKFAWRETLSGFESFFLILIPGFSLRSNPGLKLANAFGVFRLRILRRGFSVVINQLAT